MAERAEHPLIEPRFLGAVTVAAFGGGVALTLILGRMLLDIGLVIGIISAAGIVVIYYKQYKSLYVATRTHFPHEGATYTEIIIATGIASLLIFLVAYTFVYESATQEQIALIAIDKIEPEVITGSKSIEIFSKKLREC